MTDKQIHVRFAHGLGDVANFAFSIPLWTRRGYTVAVDVTPDKAPMIAAAGGVVRGGAPVVHNFWHAPAPGHPGLNDHWAGSKVGWNLSQSPMPTIGRYDDLWPEYCGVKLSLRDQYTAATRRTVDDILAGVDGPAVLVHAHANTSAGAKDLSRAEEAELYRALLRDTDATILTLDWDTRSLNLPHRRVRKMDVDFPKLNILELACLMDRAALLIGVDSGPMHLARFTDIPVLGLWHGHTVSHFALPRDRSAHISTSNNATWNRHRRHSFHVIECGPTLDGRFIAGQAGRVLAGTVGRELVLEDLMDRVNTLAKGEIYRDRDTTFRLVADHLRAKECPVMVETGCVRKEEDFTAGFSSYIFGLLLDGMGRGQLHSVDIDGGNVEFARKWTAPFGGRVRVHQSDSVAWMREYNGPPIDVLYLDSLDSDQAGHAQHALAEAEAVLPRLAADALVLVDDCPAVRGKWTGKGAKVVPWLIGQGLRVASDGYQVLLAR